MYVINQDFAYLPHRTFTCRMKVCQKREKNSMRNCRNDSRTRAEHQHILFLQFTTFVSTAIPKYPEVPNNFKHSMTQACAHVSLEQ